MTELAEQVLDAEIVEDHALVLAKRTKAAILERAGVVKTEDGEESPGSTLAACAQHVGLDPEVLRSVISKALSDKSDPNHNFAVAFGKKMAEREDYLAREGFRLATLKKDAAFFRTALERQHKDWADPRSKGSSVTVQVGIVNKLQQAQGLRANPELPTGD